ncbi:MAG TPA: kynureninase [Steroidobacter sp.]|nr:kynureninase [Steroidobacter sp.]
MNKPTAALDAARSFAEQQDAQDPLAQLRTAFHIPPRSALGRGAYLCGHSLGLQPKAVAGVIAEELDSWAQRAVEGHFESPHPWLSYHEALTPSLARLVGALPIEVAAMNTLTVNLHLMLASFYRPTRARRKILIEKRAFSSDRYAAAAQIRLHGFDPREALIEIGPRAGEDLLRMDDVCERIEREADSIAAVLLPGVQYLSGQRYDLERIACAARRHGCAVGFDLAHSVGNTPLQLHEWNVDFAVWCGYKYLNGGPGAVGACFVHERHAHEYDLPRLAGWWGHDKSSRFAMPEEFRPIPGAEGWQVSNIPILSTAPLRASLELFDEVGMDALRAKSLRLTGYLEALLDARLQDSVSIITPRDPQWRGCQLSLRLHRSRDGARAVFEALCRRGFIGDWREPDVVRVAPVPMYNTFVDVWAFVQALAEELH